MSFSASVSAAELRSERPSKFEYRDNVFYVDDPALGFVRSMPIETFLQNFEGAAKAIIAYHASISLPLAAGKVIPFRKAS